jgi:hypothetical protein
MEISELRKQAAATKAVVTKAAASVEVELATSSSHFVMRDIHPAAAEALREFASQVVGGAWDGSAMWMLDPAGTA